MNEVFDQVRTELRARLVARGAADDFADARVFDDVYGLFRQALAHNSRHVLLLPDLLADEWRPELALRLTSHRRGPVAWLILFVKRRVLLPLTRWLFEYSLENFRRQDRLNIVLMACLQSLAAEHARLRLRVAALEAAAGAPERAAPGAGSSGR
jgi:hypothetical protein